MLTGRVQLGPISVLRSPMDRRVKPGDDELFDCRDAPSHPSFAHAKKSQAKKHSQETPPLKEGRRSAEKRTTGPHRKAMRRASFLLPLMLRGPRPRGPHGAGALAFRRPTAASEAFSASARLRPRFLEPPDANGRTLSGTSAASTSRSGTRRTGRCPSRPRAQCIATPTRTAPAPPSGVPSRKASFASGMLVR
jgi:hypothetical protein